VKSAGRLKSIYIREIEPWHVKIVAGCPGKLRRSIDDLSSSKLSLELGQELTRSICAALGQMEGRPFSIAKIAVYMHVPRATVMRRLDRLESWGLVYRYGRHYLLQDKALNSFIGMRSYQQIRRLLRNADEELTVLDTLPD
jgi:DNA-binding transcriptional ArsR family regulator